MLSIIIPAFNEEESIELFLKSLRISCQNFQKITKLFLWMMDQRTPLLIF